MRASSDALVTQLPRVTLVLGKGGVGKTTTAAALALHASRTVGRTLLLTTDPARALPAVLDVPVGAAATPVAYAPSLHARVLDAGPLRTRFMDRWGDVLRTILDRGTYLDASDITPLLDTAMPGGDEIFAALALAELLASPDGDYERIIVDTAPTGHTLRLLQLPRTFRALVALLESMQAKHRFMVRALTRTYRADAADAFLAEMTSLVDALEATLTDPTQCAAVMVTQRDAVVQEETRRYVDALRDLRIHVAAIVWNSSTAVWLETGATQYVVPPLAPPPVGEQGLNSWLQGLRSAGVPSRQAASTSTTAQHTRESSSVDLRELVRPLTIVAGKGGVGKTTVAATLALAVASAHRTLVVSTDPAPSLADVLDLPIGDAEIAIPAAPQLHARQMDASAAFTRLREEYRSRVDALFAGLVSSGVDLAADRAIVRDLLALAPPGVDEVYALSVIADALFDDKYERVVVDPAPTGHLLRLLEMPQLALNWCHQLLRLMLKYKEVAGLGESAAEILDFSRKLRALDALLHDTSRAGMVLVTLDQAVVAQETARLTREVERLGVAITGVVVNRATTATALPVADAPVHLHAPLMDSPPIGADALQAWGASWITGRRDRDASRG